VYMCWLWHILIIVVDPGCACDVEHPIVCDTQAAPCTQLSIDWHGGCLRTSPLHM
jgi:hypothetical protein